MSIQNAAEECLTIDFKFDPLEVDETVDDVEKLIREEFPGLETLPLMWNGVLCQKITSKEIMEQKYSFHPFYAILTRRNDSKLEIKLVAFNGKLVSSEVVESIGSLKQGSGILNNLTETKLCQGIRELEDIHNSKHLLEYLNDEVVCRHMKCRYRISPSRSSNTTLCSNCQRLRDSIQPETRGSSPSSISTRTKSRNKKRKIDYNEEELDDNNFQELKLEYLEEEDVYLDINMSDTQVGIVSITDREDCPENVKIKLPDVSEQGDQIKKQSSPSDESLGKNYACQYCQSQLQSKLSKTKHEKNCKKSNSPPEVRKPARVEKLKCPVCFAQFRYDKNFDLHMEFHKAKDSYFQTIECPDCSVKIQGSDINIHYAKTHDPDMGVCLACLRCMKKASLPTHYSSNHRMTLPRLKKTYLCTECGKVFKMNCDLQRHIAKTHNKEDLSVMCQHCGQVMQDARALMRHVYRHHNKRKIVFPCRFCPKEFKTREARNKHVRIHSKTKPHKCKLCDYRSYSRYNVWLHIKSVHKDLEPSYSLMVQEGDFEYDEDKGNGKVPYEVPASKSTPDINSEENE